MQRLQVAASSRLVVLGVLGNRSIEYEGYPTVLGGGGVGPGWQGFVVGGRVCEECFWEDQGDTRSFFHEHAPNYPTRSIWLEHLDLLEFATVWLIRENPSRSQDCQTVSYNAELPVM